MKTFFLALFHRMRTMLQKVNRGEKYFFQKYEKWLNAFEIFLISAISQKTPVNEGGRPPTEVVSCSQRTK